MDFFETFSPIIKPTTIVLLLALAVSNDWHMRQLDVQTVFLHGHLQEDVFTTLPSGFVNPACPDYVCKLQKSLYGLKQSPRAWYMKLSEFLQDYGFLTSKTDTSLFIYRNQAKCTYVLVYVDDILVIANDASTDTTLLQALAIAFPIKDMGFPHYFLGIKLHKTSSGLILSQQKYILDLLIKSKMDGTKPASTPMSSSRTLVRKHSNPFTDPTLFRHLVGSLQYLSLTRPNLSFAIGKLSQMMHDPSNDHWDALKKVLRYLKGTIQYGLFLSKNSSQQLTLFTDADWASCPNDRRSTTGYVLYFGSNPISRSSKKQNTVARSSIEAEFRAVANGLAEVPWVQSLCFELGLFLSSAPRLLCDNIGDVYLSANPIFHSRMKHVEIDFHYV